MDTTETNIRSLKVLTLFLFGILLSGLLSAQDKPLVLGEGMNLQKDYPVVPILFGTSNAGMRTTGECWSSLGTGYVHINGDFKGKDSAPSINVLDDGSYGPINLGWDFTFYGQTYNSLYINVNGNITFGAPYSAYSASGFPSSSVPAMVAPFWADVDLRGNGSGLNNVYVKLEAGKIIVQWVQVGFYKENTDPRNTFQVVLTDAQDTDIGVGYNTRFAYGEMNWGVGNASGGTSGFGTTTYATVGAQSNAGNKFYQIGLFGQNNSNYDGPGGAIDGVHYLDGRCFTMDLRTLNVPPVANDLPESREINLSVGMSYSLNSSYAAPESGQSTSVDISNNTLSNFNVESIPGNLSTQNISFTANQSDIGSHYIYIHAHDNGIPSASTHDTILVNVYGENSVSEEASLSFDGVNDHAVVQHNRTMYSAGKGTFSFWVMPSLATVNQMEAVIHKLGQYEVNYDRNTSKVKFTGWKQGVSYTLESLGVLTKGRWNHVAFVYDGEKIQCYINGGQDSSIPFEGSPSNSSFPLYIGTNNLKETFFQGKIDELSYLGTSFNLERIRKIMFELEGAKSIYQRYYFKCNNSPVLLDHGPEQNNGVLHEFDIINCWKRNYASIWDGSFNSSWSAAENWESGLVPLMADNGSILKETYVVIPKLVTGNNALSIIGNVEVNNLIVQDSSFFALQSNGDLTIKQNFYGNKSAMFLGTVNFNGNTTQRIFGENTFFNLTIDNQVYLEGNQGIKEDLILNSDILNVNGKTLTLLSDTNGSAEVYHNSGSISGPIVAQRTISYKPNSKGWHYLTSPVIGATFSQVNETVPLRGFGNGPSDTPWPNVYLYDESVPNQNKMVGWWSPDSMGQVIQQSQGFILFYNKSQPKTISFTGVVHTGQKKRKITNTNSNRVESDGWNLVGNPYPSMLNWDLVSFSSAMDGALYLYDNESDRYSSYVNGVGVNGGTSEVASTQSFFVKSSSETAFTLENNTRITGKNKGWFRTTQKSNVLKIQVKTATDKDEVVIVNNVNASEVFDSETDAYKLSSDNPSFEIYLKWDDIRFSIKNLPVKENDIIPLYITAIKGKYNLMLEESSFFSSDFQVFVEDLISHTTYEFPINSDVPFETDKVKDFHRFNLVFKSRGLLGIESSSSNNGLNWSYGSNELKISGITPNSRIQIYNVAGKLLANIMNETDLNYLTIPWGYSRGIFFVKVSDKVQEKILKISVHN
ncbi:MAG: hypothetical protein ACJAZ2_001777 [Glaciecola sp.]|jgi:hypothetical protein